MLTRLCNNKEIEFIVVSLPFLFDHNTLYIFLTITKAGVSLQKNPDPDRRRQSASGIGLPLFPSPVW